MPAHRDPRGPDAQRRGDERLRLAFPGLDLVLVESGGDNLASTFSLDLVDHWLFVIDAADGDDIPRKRGPGIVSCDLLIINKIDLAPYVGADVAGMQRDSLGVRDGKPVCSPIAAAARVSMP